MEEPYYVYSTNLRFSNFPLLYKELLLNITRTSRNYNIEEFLSTDREGGIKEFLLYPRQICYGENSPIPEFLNFIKVLKIYANTLP